MRVTLRQAHDTVANESRLYRVEIHKGGKVDKDEFEETATFKWSRENGSVVFPIVETDENDVILEFLDVIRNPT